VPRRRNWSCGGGRLGRGRRVGRGSGRGLLRVRQVCWSGYGGMEDEPGNEAPIAYMNISTSVIIMNAISL